MASLIETIEQVKERFAKHRSDYEQNEAAVKAQLIQPLLRALGWDLENPDEVQYEYTTGAGRADYALFLNDRKILFIEAKSLNSDIRSRDNISQLARYSFDEGLKWGVLSNGSTWLLFRTFTEDVKVMDRIVWSVDIAKDDLKSVMRQLISISKDRINQIETLILKNQKMEEVWKELLNDKIKLVQSLIPLIKSEMEISSPEYQYDEEEITSFVEENVNQLLKPTQELSAPLIYYEPPKEGKIYKSKTEVSELRIGNLRFQIHKQKQILEIVANWLIDQGKLKYGSIPERIRKYLNEKGQRSNGKPFYAGRKLKNGLFIETSFGFEGAKRFAERLLQEFGYDPNILEIK